MSCHTIPPPTAKGFAGIANLPRHQRLKKIMLITSISIVAAIGSALLLWTPDRSRESLEAKYLHAPSDMIDVDGVRLHVRDDGPRDARAVVMLHGFGSSLHTWEAWSNGLDNEFRVIRFDLPGSGLSPPDPSGDYTDARTVKLVLALLDQLGIERASVIGNSIGGRIAWNFAAQHPGRVDKLVLVAPDGFASPGFEYGKAPAVPSIMGVMRYVLPKAILRMNLAPSYGDRARLSEDAVTRYYDLMLAPGVRGAVLARMQQTRLQPPEPLLARIDAPVLLVWGQKDAMIPFANAADYTKNLHNSRVVSFATLGHVPQEEAPAESLPPVRAFLLEAVQAARRSGIDMPADALQHRSQ